MSYGRKPPKNLDYKTMCVGIGFLFGSLSGLAANQFLKFDYNSAFFMLMICAGIGVCIGFAVGEKTG